MPVQYSSGFVPTSDYYTRDYDINNGLLKVELLNRPGGGVQALITFGRVSHESEVLLSEVGSVTIDVFTDTFTGAGSTTVEKYRYSDGYVLVFVWVDSTNSLPVRRIGKIINITHIYEILDRTYNTIVDLKVIYDTYEFMRENDVLFNTTKYFVTGEAFYTMRLEEKKLDKYKYSTQEVFSYFGTSQLVINFGASCEFIVVDGGLTVIYIDQFMQRIYVEYLSESGITDYSYDVYPIDQYNIDYTKQILITSNKKAIYLFCNRTIDIDQATTAIVPFVFIFSPDGRILHATNIIATTNIGEYGGPYTFAVGHLETEGLIVSIYDSTYNHAMIYIAKCCVFEPVGRIDSITTPINRIALFGRQIILSTSGGNYISIPINGTVSQYITETDLMTPVFNLNQDETYNGIYSNSVEFFFLPYPPQNTYLVLNVLHNADVLMSDSTLVIRFVDSNNFNITSINVPLNRRVDNSTITVPVPAISPPMISISKVVIENTNGQNIFVYGAHVITSVMPKQLLSAGDPRFAYSYLGTNSLAKIEAVDVYVSDNQHILGDETESYTAFKVYDMPESYDGYYNILITDKTFYLSLYSNGLDRVIGAVGTTIPNPGGSIVIDPPNNIYGFYYPKAKPVLLSVPRKAWFIPINPSRLISLINKSFYNTNYYVVQSVGGAVSPGPNDLQFNNRWDSPDGIGFYSDVSPQSYRMTLQSTGGGATFGNTVALLGHKLGLGDRAFIHGEIVFPYSATRTIDNNAKILSIAIGRGNASLTPYDLNSANEKIYPFFVIAWYPISDTYCIATPTKEKLYVLSGKDIINAGADVVLPFTLTVDFLTNRYILSIDVTNGQLSSYILSIGDRQYGDLDSFLNDTNVINSIVEFQNGSIFYVGESKMAGYGKDLVLAFSSVTDANNNSVDKSMLSYMPLIANLSNSSL